ncbi:MAG TPA: Gfo/Idh/MocA family oxidoreductase [Clostridiaceae bacterium]|nr:Gfo/Idh/MocA family oxidoreductase [Clostridiaceae bacterium]
MKRLGIIGTGIIAHENYKGIEQTGKAEVVALCNRTYSKGVDFANKYGLKCPVYSDYRKMVDEVKPDIVLINTPHDLHEEMFIYCADRKIDIIIEKPLSDTAASSEAIVESANKNGIKAAVCHTQRFNTAFITAKKFIKNNNLGKLIAISDFITYNYFWEGRPEWFLEPARAGGGIVMNYGVHQFDRVHYMAEGKTVSLFAHIDWEKEGIAVDSSYQIMGIMDNGVTYTIACTGYTGPFANGMELRFTGGILRVYLCDTGIESYGVYYGDNNFKNFVKLPLVESENRPYYNEMKAIMDYMEGSTEETPVSVEYAAQMVKLVEAAKMSHERQVSINTL